jgi:hypothetical protein
MQDRNYSNRDNNSRNNDGDGDSTQLFIAKGRNDGMDAGSLVEFVSGKTNIDQSRISNVKVLDAFSFFAVPNEDAEMILSFFQDEAGEGRPLVSKAKRKKPSGGFGDRREGGFGDRPRRDFNDRPRRDFGDRDRPRRDFNDRPRRDYNE